MSSSDVTSGIGSFFFDVLNVFVNGLVKAITSPIDKALKASVPNFSQFGIFLNTTLKSLLGLMAWICDALLINPVTLAYCSAVITFAISATVGAWFVKVTVRWYHIMMP